MSKTAADWLKEAQPFVNVSKHQEAIACYDKGLAVDPNHVDTLIAKGLALLRLNKPKEGIPFVERAIEINPQKAIAYSRKGMMLKATGELDKALEFVEKALAVGPNDPNVDIFHTEKAIVLREMDRDEEAMKSYRRAVKINPKRVNAYWGLGITLEKHNRHEEALEAYRNAAKHQPAAMYWMLIGKCLQKLGREKEALEAFSTCVDFYDKGQPGVGLSTSNLNFIKNELKAVKELQAVAAQAEAKAKELEAKAKETGNTNNPVVQKFLSQMKTLQADKDKITKTVIEKSGSSQSDKDELQRVKDEFQKKLAEMEAMMQKQMNEVKKDVTTLKKDVEKLQKGFAEVKEELDNKLDDFNKKLNKTLTAQDLSPEDRAKMKEYYGAFIGTFSSIYVTSQVVDSGQVQLDADSSVASVLSMVASFAPFIGDALSSGVKSLGDFLQAKEMKTNAKKMKRLANDPTELSQLVGKVAFELSINPKKQQKVIKTTGEDLEKVNGNLFDKLKKICEKIGDDVDAWLYTKLYSSPASRVGHNDANFLIEKWISESVKPFDISDQFVKFILAELEKPEDSVANPTPNLPSNKQKSSCCTMF